MQLGEEGDYCDGIVNCDGQSHKTVSTNTQPFRREGRVESSRGPSAYQPNALPLGQTSPQTRYSK